MCLMVWKRTFYGNIDLSTTCQCRQLKLNPLSTQINIYCLMTNQTPALLVQRAPWTRAAVMLLQFLYFSRPPSPHPPQSYNPRTPAPSVHLKNKITATVRSGISKRSHEKIGDCEQSKTYRTTIREAQNLNTWGVDLGPAAILSVTWWNSMWAWAGHPD